MTLLEDRPAAPVDAPWAGPLAVARPPRQRAPLSSNRIAIAGTLALVCAVALWAVVFAVYLGGLQESRQQKIQYTQFRTALANEVAPLGGVIAAGTPVALISIPKAGISNVVVFEGTSSEQTEDGPGHLPDSVLPGQVGASVIFGRGALFGAPFRHVPSLKPGDVITTTTQQGVHTYTVVRVRRAGDPVVPLAAGSSRLTLVTSEGSGLRAGWGAGGTVYVDAALVGKATFPLGGQPTAVAADELPMQGDTDNLVLVVFGLQGLILVGLGAVWLFHRWSRLQAFAVVLPVVVGIAWWTTDQAAQLLPNLF